MQRRTVFLLLLTMACTDDFTALDRDAGSDPVIDGAVDGAVDAAQTSPQARFLAATAGAGAIDFRIFGTWIGVTTSNDWLWTPEGTTPLEAGQLSAVLRPRSGGHRWFPQNISRACFGWGYEQKTLGSYSVEVGPTEVEPPDDDTAFPEPTRLTFLPAQAGELRSRELPGEVWANSCVFGPNGNVHFVGTALRGTDLGGGPLGGELPGTARRIAFVASFDDQLRHRYSAAIAVTPHTDGLYAVALPDGRVGLFGTPYGDTLWGEPVPTTPALLATLDVADHQVDGIWEVDGLYPFAPQTWYDESDTVLFGYFRPDADVRIGARTVTDPAPRPGPAADPSSAFFYFDGSEPAALGASSLMPRPPLGTARPLHGTTRGGVRETVPDQRGPTDVVVDARLIEGGGIDWVLGTDADHDEGALYPQHPVGDLHTDTREDGTRVTTVLAPGRRTVGNVAIGTDGEPRVVRVELDLMGDVLRAVDLGSGDDVVGSSSCGLDGDRYLVQRTGELAVVEDGGRVLVSFPITASATTDCAVGGEAAWQWDAPSSKGHWIVDVACEGASEVTVRVGDAELTIPRSHASIFVEVEVP